MLQRAVCAMSLYGNFKMESEDEPFGKTGFCLEINGNHHIFNNPICSRYGIFTCICHKSMANVVRIHGAHENGKLRVLHVE